MSEVQFYRKRCIIMIRIFKYLKSSYKTIAIIVVLLVMQAIFDLTLPEYTARIINVGVQQSGIEDTAPRYISDTTLENLAIFINDEDIELIRTQYTFREDLFYYELNTTDRDYIEKISTIMKIPLIIDASIIGGELFEVPEGMNPYSLLLYMSEEDKEAMINGITETINAMPDAMIEGAAINRIKLEYEALDIDILRMQTNYILSTGLRMVGIAFLIMAISILVGLLGARMAAKLAQVLREKVFKKVMKFSKTEIKSFGVASLITRSTNDITQVQNPIVFLLRVVFYSPILAIGGIIKITELTTSMGWIIGVALGITIIVMGFLFIIVLPKFKKIQLLTDKLNLVSREILTGLPVIRAFNNERHEEERFDNTNTDLAKVLMFIAKSMAVLMPLIMLIMNLVVVAIVWTGTYQIDAGTIQVGDMMAYIQYSMQIIMSFVMMTMLVLMLPRAQVSASRIMEVIETKEIIKNSEHIEKMDSKKRGIVEFKNVGFRYPDASEDVISNVNFKAEPGTTTAFIGSTGSGKSTIINLIPRFYDVTEGSILVDGVDIRNVDIDTLRHKIGFVPQKGILFSGTIESNIKYSDKEINDEMMKESARIAQAKDFIEESEETYKREVSQGGTNVSGGQRQRLSIARAIAINPDIYIFDDSFSALDFKTDARLRKELKKVTKNSTVFIVAQRINTIMSADQIVVLNEGKVVGIGTHKELLNTCEVYKEIALSQLSEEELQNG